jgi:hypothetical protein
MPLESDDNQATKPKELVSFSGMLVEETRKYACDLDKGRSIYYGYAAFDSLSSSYSMFKYFYDLCLANSNKDPNAMHDFMMTPGGIIAITAESLFLVLFSVLAVKFDNDDDTSNTKWIATAWPYFRDVIKGLKNAYKGWRSAVGLLSLVSASDLKYIINPVGLLLGILAAANRFWQRSMTEKRKAMMVANTNLIKEIHDLPSLTYEQRQAYVFKLMQYQSNETRIFAYLSVAAGGTLDGLYLYFGVLGLAALSLPMLYVLVAVCVFYNIACIITRVFEEYEFQQRLLITQTQCNLELVAKQLQTNYSRLLSLLDNPIKTHEENAEVERLRTAIFWVLNDFETYRNLLDKQSNHSFASAALLGLKHGLYAYGALASIIFLSSGLLSLAGVAFPPGLLIFTVFIGLVFIAVFTAHSLFKHYRGFQEEPPKVNSPYDSLVDMKDTICQEGGLDNLPDSHSILNSINDGLHVPSLSPSYFKEWFEIVRSLFSGFGKGQRFGGYAGNFMQELDEKGRYQDSTLLVVLELITGLFFGIVLALRALAKGLGRVPLGQEQTFSTKDPLDGASSTIEPVPLPLESEAADISLALDKPNKKRREVLHIEASGELILDDKPQENPPAPNPTPLSTSGFFKVRKNERLRLTCSEGDLPLMAQKSVVVNTIEGLK